MRGRLKKAIRTDAVLMPQQAQFLTRLALQKKG